MQTHSHRTAPGHPQADNKPSSQLICHIIYRLDFGGLENGLVNLINRLPANRFRHAVICLTYASEFRKRIQRNDVDISLVSG